MPQLIDLYRNSGFSHVATQSVYNIVTILRLAPVQRHCKVELLVALVINDDDYRNFTARPDLRAGSV